MLAGHSLTKLPVLPASLRCPQPIGKEQVMPNDHIIEDSPEAGEHWHIVTFINGCLNDTDDGPYDTIGGARDELTRVVEDAAEHDYPWIPAGEDRYVRGNHILKIESCRENIEECNRAC